jgi:methyl-accepting chemotaxis protein
MPEERKKIWIDTFQTRLFLRMAGYWLIYQVTLWNLVFVWRLLHDGPGNLLEQYGRFCLDYAPVLVGCLALLPILAWDAVKFAHRLVGPVYSFRKALRALAAGDAVRPVKLRQDDFLTEMRDDFNTMLEAFERRGVPVLKPADDAAPDQERQPA